jgi:lysyl-tRNA synthetase class 2
MMAGRDANGDWRPGASRLALESRATLLADIRNFFASRQVLEVETPVISRFGNSDPNIQNVSTDEHPPGFLRTSPEYAMKRLLCSGSGDIYELGRVFRKGERGRQHNPEFTLLEWYRQDMNYLELATEVTELVRHCGRGKYDEWPVVRSQYRELFQVHCGVDPWTCSEPELELCARDRGIVAPPMGASEWLDLLMTEVIQPSLHGHSLTIVFDFPPEQAALSRIRDGDRQVAERFEIFLGQVELANGFQELDDAEEQRRRFERENRQRAARGEMTPPLDRLLLDAIEHGLPHCSGVALGVDRLLMALTDLNSMDAVLAFSAGRA